jgi:hypothetical protein
MRPRGFAAASGFVAARLRGFAAARGCAADFHDREGFATPRRSEPFAIMQAPGCFMIAKGFTWRAV